MAKVSFDYSALVAAHVASKGVTKLEAVDMSTKEAKARDRAIARKASGYEADVVKNYIWECLLEGEDGGEHMQIVKAKSLDAAEEYCGKQWPESRVMSIAPEGDRDARLYREVSRYF